MKLFVNTKWLKGIFIFLFVITYNATFAQDGTYTDSRDGQSYKTVKMGKLLWMAEDFAFETEEGCWYYAEDERLAKKNKLGRLYTWEAAKEACPEGWRLPTSDEYEEMYMQFGQTDAERLKAIGPKGGGGITFNYTGRRAGIRSMSCGYEGYYWSSDIKHSLTGKIIPGTAWHLSLNKKNKWMHITSYAGNVDDGFAVRYVKDVE